MQQVQESNTDRSVYKIEQKQNSEYLKLVLDPIEPIYNVVNINDNLPIVEKKALKMYKSTQKNLFEKKFYSLSNEKHREISEKNLTPKVVSYYENISANWNFTNCGLYDAFCCAYNLHRDVILSPDDVWMTILLEFTKYVNKNAEQMRHMFVEHEGQKYLEVKTNLELDEEDWTEFFLKMNNKIRNNTLDGVIDTLSCDFSTTGHVEQLLSVATIMNTFKSYFKYGRCIPLCGIRNVLFMGSLEDWLKLSEKLDKLKKYSINQEWENYVSELQPIILQFIESYKGNVDKKFWDSIMNFRHGRIGSGSTTYVTGWILKFYGLNGEVDVGDIKQDNIDVQVKVINENTNTIKMMDIVGGITGIANIEDKSKNIDAFRPQMSFIVFHDGNVEYSKT